MTSRQVAWWPVYQLVAGHLGSQPQVIAGTPAWQQLPDDHPDKWAAIWWAAVWWALETDIRQECFADTSHEISRAADWPASLPGASRKGAAPPTSRERKKPRDRRRILVSHTRTQHDLPMGPRTIRGAPWAVFGAVLLRVAASTGPHVQHPGVIGGRASLNMMATFVAPSGGGKGISDKVARLAWPTGDRRRRPRLRTGHRRTVQGTNKTGRPTDHPSDLLGLGGRSPGRAGRRPGEQHPGHAGSGHDG
ncbi:hypothetical protein MAUB1S_01528 [Mycolicibacterium aubagnense]